MSAQLTWCPRAIGLEHGADLPHPTPYAVWMIPFLLSCAPFIIHRWMMLSCTFSPLVATPTLSRLIWGVPIGSFLSTLLTNKHLLGVNLDDAVWVDHCLVFGLRLAPKIFTAFADTVAWSLHVAGACGVSYLLLGWLFLFFAPPSACFQWCQSIPPYCSQHFIRPTHSLSFW